MDQMLECERVTKSFGTARVLNGVSFSLQRGECLALLGPSGCGKSTLLNLVSGILESDEGVIRCDGEVMDDPARNVHVSMRKRRFAMVFQDFSLWPHMTVAENVAFGLKIQNVSRAEAGERVKEVLQRVSMQSFSEKFPAALSGGQQQRVAIARALVVRPKILLLDEPLSALDARLRDELREEIAALIRQLEMTALYVTHDQVEALTVADRVAVMREGIFEQIAPPREIYSRPASAYVGRFLGNANCFDFKINDAGLMLDGKEALSLAAGQLPGQAAGVCMLRRESVRILPASAKVSSGHFGLNAVCERSSYLGDRCEVTAGTASALVVRGYSPVPVVPGDRVVVEFAPGDLLFSDQ